ncbi:MAG TPA: FAD-dependent monooxygenase, partial [Burkholderiales bacterium]|nr:FAD-dependent monooxygenase [Burkholderiales bacterium]
YEQAAELKEVGAGVQISANGTRALYALGLGEGLRALACEPSEKEVRLWNSGQAWKLFDVGATSVARFGFPYFTMYRPDLLDALVAGVRAAAPQAIHLGRKASSFVQEAGRVTLHFADGGTAGGDILVGADGVHSKVRAQLWGADAPQFTGCMAWRGIVPMEKLPAHLARLVGTNWLGPGGHVVHYPLHGGKVMNFVGVVERDDWQVESWSVRGTHAEALSDFAGWHEDVQTLIRNIGTPYKWALMGRAPMAQWSQGNVTLLGDACHPTLPFMAQGAVMAIEDGMVLARALDTYPDIAQALRRYEDARRERTAKVVQGSAANAKRFHSQSLSTAAEAQAYLDREFSEARVQERYDWLFEYDVLTTPV